MSGGVEFSRERFVALADHITARAGLMPSVKLAILMWRLDFDAYASDLGKSITGATWMRGTWERPVYVCELGEPWFRRYIADRCGLVPRAIGRAVAVYAALAMMRGARR